MTDERKTVRVNVYLTPTEKRALDFVASKDFRKPADWARVAVLTEVNEALGHHQGRDRDGTDGTE